MFINQGFKCHKSKVAALHYACLFLIFVFHINLGSSLSELHLQSTFYLDYHYDSRKNPHPAYHLHDLGRLCFQLH